MNKTLTIVGLGPRGVTILERLASLFSKYNGTLPLTINIVSDGLLGVGIHKIDDPDYLALNVMIGYSTAYTDSSTKGITTNIVGPTLYEWLIGNNFKLCEDGISVDEINGRELEFSDYLPRSYFGRYLNWAANNFISKLKKKCKVVTYNAKAVNVISQKEFYTVELDSGIDLLSDFIILCTGHSTNKPTPRDKDFLRRSTKLKVKNPELLFVADPYPIAKIPTLVSKNVTVGLEGIGLAGFDVLSALTIGKGGRYIKNSSTGKLRYLRSGQEPKKIFVYSLDGLTLAAQASVQHYNPAPFEAKIFTNERVKKLKQELGKGTFKQLDFEQHLLPEIIKEMQYAYYTTLLTLQYDEPASKKFGKTFITLAHNPILLQELIDSHVPAQKQLIWEDLVDPMRNCSFEDRKSCQEWLIEFLERDYLEALKGYELSPIKSSHDILRKIRYILADVVNFSGLTPDSHKVFYEIYMPIFNRLAVGPPKERIAELLSLMEEGIVDFSLGKKPTLSLDDSTARFQLVGENIKNKPMIELDIVIKARTSPPIPELDLSPLMKNCLESGLLQPYKNGSYCPGGINIDPKHHPISTNGVTQLNLWALGILTEGPKIFTNHVIAIPNTNSPIFNTTHELISELIEKLGYSIETEVNMEDVNQYA